MQLTFAHAWSNLARSSCNLLASHSNLDSGLILAIISIDPASKEASLYGDYPLDPNTDEFWLLEIHYGEWEEPI